MAALQRVIPEDVALPLPRSALAALGGEDVPPPLLFDHVAVAGPSRSAVTALNNFSTVAGPSSMNFIRWNVNSNFSAAAESAFVPVASTSADADIIDLTSDIDLDAANKANDAKMLTFNIHFNQQIYTIRLQSNATVDNLKTKIADATKVPMCRQAIRGWPPAKLHEAQKPTRQLCTLGLSFENELILIDLTEEGYMDTENSDATSSEDIQRLDCTFHLNIVEQPSGKQIQLDMSGKTTIQEVKTNVYYISDIPVRHQEWTGWPQGCNNDTTLARSGIELSHNFIIQNAVDKIKNNSKSSTSASATNAVAIDTDSSADEFEDASDFNACEEFFTDSPPVQPPRHLIPINTDDETQGSIQFVENYVQRFGEPHPVFFTGSLEDALKEACHKPARDRKLLAIYLHHGESILTNVFCDHLMKHESIMQTFEQNFILYGWDLTFESNKHLFLSFVTGCVGNTASLTVRNIPIDKLPSILVIGKSRLSGRTSCEVLSVIHGNVGLDEILTRLLEAVEMYTEHLQVEIREEDERAARDQVKAEQDMAYQETLEADMAKEAAKRQKEAVVAAERQRLESEKAEDEAKRESIRLVRALATASYGMEVYFKKELMLFTGSYKERSALNTLLSLTDSQKKAGIVTASTGNFAMAVSFYGRKLDVAVTVVLPKGTPIQKVQKCRNFNARTVVEGKDMTEVKAAALKMAKEKGFLYLNGCDHPGVMAGGGTIGIEILEDVPEPDAVIVPVGNGGLIAGIAVAIKTLSPRTQIIGVESDKCPCFSAALDNNQPIHTHPKKSLADALSLPMAGYNSFFTVQPLIDKMVVVREEWLTLAMLRLTEEEKCIVEGSGAAGLAAILTGLLIELKGKKVVVVLSGGNIYTPMFSHCLDRGLAADGRLIKFCILIKDKPGGLSALCELLTVLDVTIRSIAHRRQEERDIFGVKVQVLCETRNWNHSLALENDLKKNYGEVEFAEIPLILQEQFVPEPPQKKINKPCAKYVQPQQNILL